MLGLLELRLSRSWLIELEEEDELVEVPPRLALSACRSVAPWELDEIDASCDRTVPAAEESPASMA